MKYLLNLINYNEIVLMLFWNNAMQKKITFYTRDYSAIPTQLYLVRLESTVSSAVSSIFEYSPYCFIN